MGLQWWLLRFFSPAALKVASYTIPAFHQTAFSTPAYQGFIQIDRQTDYLLPPSLDEWLPRDHLARFAVEVIDGQDLTKLTSQYAGRGAAAHHPATLLAMLV